MAAAVLGTLLMSATAQAAYVMTINYNDQEFRGETTLRLKQELQRLYPRTNINDLEIRGVRLIAKSRMGQGFASLIVGNDQSFEVRVDGGPRFFDSNDPRTYQAIDIWSPSRRDSFGVWQIALRGNIKVKQVQVQVEEARFVPGGPGHGPGRPGRPGPGPGHGPGRPGPGWPGPR
ncbi:MAG: hypothetical protein ABS42_00170 [Bdellovibrio sp. SCN 50-8]|nr:MAG: hypothetical protein ABS42_00170 [Bdellovibrio sp. SCN 50-8]